MLEYDLTHDTQEVALHLSSDDLPFFPFFEYYHDQPALTQKLRTITNLSPSRTRSCIIFQFLQYDAMNLFKEINNRS